MTKLGKYTPKTTLPGEYVTRNSSPAKSTPVVVKLQTGEKVQLLAPEKSQGKRHSVNSPWESSCKSIKTIPGNFPDADQIPRSGSHPQISIFGGSRNFGDGRKSREKAKSDSKHERSHEQSHAVTPKMTGSFDVPDPEAKNPIPVEPPESVAELPLVEPHLGSTSISPGLAKSSADSTGSQWLASPQAMVSFSPDDIVEAQTRVQINFTLSEIIQSEYTYVKSLSLLGNFFIEPLLMKCTGLKLTCTPLVNMDIVIRGLREKHEKFLTRVAPEKDLDQLAQEMTDVVAEPRYGSYAACAELLLYLVSRQVPPFESSYVNNLQTFLERNQPGERRMDLSLQSLLQKPMGRIAKYRLFLGSLAKLCPEQSLVTNAMDLINQKLTEINDEIRDNKERQAVLENVSEWIDLSDTTVPVYQYYGLLNLLVQCSVVWLTYNRRGPSEIVSRDCHLLVHDNHILIADTRVQKPLFVLSFANCQFIPDPADSIGGLYNDERLAVKLVFEKEDCLYELMLVSSSADGHGALLRACERIPIDPLRYASSSDSDCFLGPAVAPFDINVESAEVLQTRSSTCYFRQAYHVCERPPGSRFRALGVMFRRGLSWQGHK